MRYLLFIFIFLTQGLCQSVAQSPVEMETDTLYYKLAGGRYALPLQFVWGAKNKPAQIKKKNGVTVVVLPEEAQTLVVTPERLGEAKEWLSQRLNIKKNNIEIFVKGQGKIATRSKQYKAPALHARVSDCVMLPAEGALLGRNIVVSNSHGAYYNTDEQQWRWQRARLFRTVEDLFTAHWGTQFLVPMLRAAGAQVCMTREEDQMPERVVVKGGTFTVPVTGKYGVHVKWPSKRDVTDTLVIANRMYVVNRQAAWGMWHLIDYLPLYEGEEYKVQLPDSMTVELGGGIGESGRARWMECAAVYLRNDGWPSGVWQKDNKNYTDDVNSRGLYINALQNTRDWKADFSIALHTDAGMAQADTTVGSLALICTKQREQYNSEYFARNIQLQVQADVHALFDRNFTTRGIWDKKYSECRLPECPAMILEMLSHQNVNDALLGQNPEFRFHYSRAVYKAIVRSFNPEAVIAPLPPRALAAVVDGDNVKMSWQPTTDPLESSATPTHYYVVGTSGDIYKTRHNSIVLPIHSKGYYVIAANGGGCSLPSSTAVVSRDSFWKKRILFVEEETLNGSPKVESRPEGNGILLKNGKQFNGSAWGEEWYVTGNQQVFKADSLWVSDDAPGYGESGAEMEGKSVKGSRLLWGNAQALRLAEDYCVSYATKEAAEAIKNGFDEVIYSNSSIIIE